MKILILGSGLMGPAAAYNALNDPEVSEVALCDVDAARLDAAAAALRAVTNAGRLRTVRLDLADRAAAAALFAEFDAVLAALPWRVSMLAFDAAIAARVPIVDLAIPEDADLPELARRSEEAGTMVLLGCGLEPGLTEIVARRLAADLDTVEELHIKCGGVPETPSGPLGYKIVFGGHELPFRDSAALAVEGGEAVSVLRYSGVEATSFAGVGACEAWHEGMMPWLLEMDEFRGITEGTQKTLRWPGYASRVSVLLELGLLSREPVRVGEVSVAPKYVVDAALYPSVRLGADEGDITLFRVEVIGRKGGERLRHCVDMVDRMDRRTGFTSMARTTAFTGAIAARMIGRGELVGAGMFTSEALIAGDAYDRMMRELEAEGIHFEHTVHPA